LRSLAFVGDAPGDVILNDLAAREVIRIARLA
jgi:hypothetical protein